jgi:hypothetical protein
MKKNILFLTIAIAATLASSCNDLLELPNDGRLTMDDVFKTRNTVRGFLNACYNYRVAPSMERDALTDDAQHADDMYGSSLYNRWYNNSLTADNYTNTDGSPWSSLYQGIRKCNIFITNIQSIDPASILTYGEELSSWTAQAHTLRALYYLEIVKRYGACPIVTEAYETTHDYSSNVRSRVSEVVAQIVSDCDAALAAPEGSDGFPWRATTGQMGSMTRALAHFIKAQALLFAVSPQFDDGSYTWTDALEANRAALGACLAHGYELFTTTPAASVAQNAYDFYFISNSDEQMSFDREYIYPGHNVAVWRDAGLPTTGGQTNAGPCPTQDLADCYEMQATGLAPITGYADEQHLKPVINEASGYSETNPYAGRDPRFYATFYYNGSSASNDRTVQTFVGGTEGISASERRFTRTGYYLRKYNNLESNRNNSADGQIRKFRLAELYLNFAEAAYHVAASPYDKLDLGNGLSLSAADAVNAIRQRAGMPNFPDGMSKSDFEKKYRNERRVEMAFEDVYYFDVRRWKTMPETSRFVSGMRITQNGDDVIYERFSIERSSYSDKFYLYPLATTEANKMNAHTGNEWQNAGW